MTQMNPDLEQVYLTAFAELSQQVEMRFMQLEKQLGRLGSLLPADESSQALGNSVTMLTATDGSDTWAFPLSAISHFTWRDDHLRVYFAGSSGERQLTLRFRGETQGSLRAYWAQLAEHVMNAKTSLIFPCEVRGGRIEPTFK